jgi:glycosyltransferase involved in cell wall biosynthesis
MINTVSLCIITYNEEHRIRRTLEYAWPHVDQIVVVDQSSTDNTAMEVARFTARASNSFQGADVKFIKDQHWGYCEPSRKKAHDNSDGEWILVLDADERISDDFAKMMRNIDEQIGPKSKGVKGVRLKRSLWLSGAHHFTGDYQYRYFRRDSVKYLDEIHTEPQPTIGKPDIWYPPFVGIWHEKSWAEQVRDELEYERLIDPKDPHAQKKRDLNVHLRRLEELEMTAEQIDALSVDERKELLGLEDFVD